MLRAPPGGPRGPFRGPLIGRVVTKNGAREAPRGGPPGGPLGALFGAPKSPRNGLNGPRGPSGGASQGALQGPPGGLALGKPPVVGYPRAVPGNACAEPLKVLSSVPCGAPLRDGIGPVPGRGRELRKAQEDIMQVPAAGDLGWWSGSVGFARVVGVGVPVFLRTNDSYSELQA